MSSAPGITRRISPTAEIEPSAAIRTGNRSTHTIGTLDWNATHVASDNHTASTAPYVLARPRPCDEPARALLRPAEPLRTGARPPQRRRAPAAAGSASPPRWYA